MQKLVLSRGQNIIPKVKRFVEQMAGGRNPFDCLVFIDTEDNVRAIGQDIQSRFSGAVDSYSPSAILTLPNGEKASKVYVTRFNMFILSTTGNVYATGNNTEGNCALPAGAGVVDVSIPTLTAINNCKKVILSSAAGTTYTAMFLTNNGQLYAAGRNQYGQIGDNSTTNTGNTGPKLSLGPSNTYGNPTVTVIDAVGVGSLPSTNVYQSFCALLSNGTVWCVGYGADGQMGNNTITAINSTWKQVRYVTTDLPIQNVVRIFGNSYEASSSFYALDSSSNLYGWGFNGQGQLGTGNTTSASRATLSSSNVLDVWSFNGVSGSVIIKRTDGKFYAAGHNLYGQLGVGDTANKTSFTEITSLNNKNIVQIFTGSGNAPCVFAKAAGTNQIYVTGYNGYGNCGVYNTTNVTSYTEVPFNVTSPIIDIMPITTEGVGSYTLILTADGQTYFTGQSRWSYIGSPNRNETIFRKNTKYIVGA